MIKTLAKCIREYKKASILAPLIIAGEVAIECFIPFVTAELVRNIEAGCDLSVIVKYGLILILLAVCSLACGAFAGHFAAIAACGFGIPPAGRWLPRYNGIDRFRGKSACIRIGMWKFAGENVWKKRSFVAENNKFAQFRKKFFQKLQRL